MQDILESERTGKIGKSGLVSSKLQEALKEMSGVCLKDITKSDTYDIMFISALLEELTKINNIAKRIIK